MNMKSLLYLALAAASFVGGLSAIRSYSVGDRTVSGLAEEGSIKWETLSANFGDRFLLHFAADPSSRDRLNAVTQESEVLARPDGGKTWRPHGSAI